MYFIFLLLLLFIPFIKSQSCKYGFVFNGTDCDECSKFSIEPNLRIMKGIPAVDFSWPAQVLIVQNYNHTFTSPVKIVSFNYQCGGTLINTQTVMTAAHCITNEIINNKQRIVNLVFNNNFPSFESTFSVYLGVNNIEFIKKHSSPPPPGIKAGVSRIIVHPSYDNVTRINDIALIILSKPVDVSRNMIKIACLPAPSSSYPPINVNAYISGWGITKNDVEEYSNNLMNVLLKTYKPDYCSGIAPDYEKLWTSQLCAGDIKSGKDTCHGDSGGGLYVMDQTLKKYIVAGVTSYGGPSCGEIGTPAIYARVSNFVNWITSNWQRSYPSKVFVKTTPKKNQSTTRRKRTTTKNK